MCNAVLVRSEGAGRPRKYCSQACRQRDWVARQGRHEAVQAEHELLEARERLQRVQDAAYVLRCALDDLRKDPAIGDDTTRETLRLSLAWLQEAAEAVVSADRESSSSGRP